MLDEPLVWGALPRRVFQSADTTRWSLAASEIVFLNDACRWFFRQGQTLEVFRGQGIFQPAVDDALAVLAKRQWVHIFPEAYVNLTRSAALRRFKWGISRLVLEPRVTPYVVPIWIMGFDQVMPHPRARPKWLPRTGAEITVTFGEPVPVDPYTHAYAAWRANPHAQLTLPELNAPPAYLYNGSSLRAGDDPMYATLRSHLAEHLRMELGKLGHATRRRLGLGDGDGTLAHRPADDDVRPQTVRNVS